MKKMMNSKVILSVLALMLIVAMAFSGCGADDGTVGTGEKSFTFEVVELDGSKETFTVKTDAKTVGEALVDEGLISGENGQYGLMVDTVNGQKYDYNADGAYWAFYVNGEYAMTGVDSTEITEGTVYNFTATKAE